MKKRLDVLLVEGGYAPSREKARAILMSGEVFVDGQREDKAGAMFNPERITLEVRGNTLKYVSRGGLKLEKALDCFGLRLAGKICMDIGASTGGFTDCMLQNGAAKVYSVDVGYGQLDFKLRRDERVVCMEKTNFRYMQPKDISDRPDFATADVSFISLTKILLPARAILREEAEMVCLVKPQFEAGRDKVEKKGVVREPRVHEEVLGKVIDYLALTGFELLHLDYSPIKGPEGNIEYLMHIRKLQEQDEAAANLTEARAEQELSRVRAENMGNSQKADIAALITETVTKAHGAL